MNYLHVIREDVRVVVDTIGWRPCRNHNYGVRYLKRDPRKRLGSKITESPNKEAERLVDGARTGPARVSSEIRYEIDGPMVRI